MVWSQFSIKIFRVHFRNSVLDYSNWDKRSHSFTKKSHTCEEGGAHLRISFWHLLMNFEKPKNQNFEKWKKVAGDISLHISNKNRNHMRYSSWDTECEFFFSLWAIFCPLPPPPSPLNNPENQTFKKMKKVSGDVIILNLCNKKHNQMVYAYSDMECDRHNFLSI